MTQTKDPITTSFIQIGSTVLTMSGLTPNSSTISPNRKTNKGRHAPVIIAKRYPMIMKVLSTRSACVSSSFKYDIDSQFSFL